MVRLEDREHLTPRQQEVMQLLALGLSTREMAARLFVSGKTIDTHLQTLRQILGADTTRQLIVVAARVNRRQPGGPNALGHPAGID